MLPGFHRVEPYANPPEPASVPCHPASSAVAPGCRPSQCIRSSPPLSLRVLLAQPVDPLVFDTVEHTFGGRVIPARLHATHGTIHAVCLQRVLERLLAYWLPRSSGHSTRRLFGERVLRAGYGATGTRSSGGSGAGPQAGCPSSSFYAAYHVGLALEQQGLERDALEVWENVLGQAQSASVTEAAHAQ